MFFSVFLLLQILIVALRRPALWIVLSYSRLTRTRTNLPPPGPRSRSFLTKNDSSPAKTKTRWGMDHMGTAGSCWVATAPHVGGSRRLRPRFPTRFVLLRRIHGECVVAPLHLRGVVRLLSTSVRRPRHPAFEVGRHQRLLQHEELVGRFASTDREFGRIDGVGRHQLFFSHLASGAIIFVAKNFPSSARSVSTCAELFACACIFFPASSAAKERR